VELVVLVGLERLQQVMVEMVVLVQEAGMAVLAGLA
jgi:hypothetical protein